MLESQHYQVYDDVAQTWSWQLSRSPAWAYTHVLMSPANKRAVATSRFNLANLSGWSDGCATPDQNGEETHTFDAVYDTVSTVHQILGDVAACGRARPGMPDGKHGVIRDVKQTVPVDHVTPRNSWGFSGRKQFIELPHGLKVQFIDPAAGWVRNEAIAYDDGFDALTASRFETIQAWGMTRSAQAWREGRFRLAEGRLRPETFECSRDIEFIPFQRGDLVRLSHDAIAVGLAWGRIKATTTDGQGKTDSITLDERVEMAAGKTYGLRVARAPGGSIYAAVDTVVGETSVLTLPAPIPPPTQPAIGDLAMFGETDAESIECIVREILPRGDDTARMIFVSAAPAMHDADTGPIPAFNPVITLPPAERRIPAKPVVDEVLSDETVLVPLPGGGWQAHILVSLSPRLDGPFPLDYLDGRVKRGAESQ